MSSDLIGDLDATTRRRSPPSSCRSRPATRSRPLRRPRRRQHAAAAGGVTAPTSTSRTRRTASAGSRRQPDAQLRARGAAEGTEPRARGERLVLPATARRCRHLDAISGDLTQVTTSPTPSTKGAADLCRHRQHDAGLRRDRQLPRRRHPDPHRGPQHPDRRRGHRTDDLRQRHDGVVVDLPGSLGVLAQIVQDLRPAPRRRSRRRRRRTHALQHARSTVRRPPPRSAPTSSRWRGSRSRRPNTRLAAATARRLPRTSTWRRRSPTCSCSRPPIRPPCTRLAAARRFAGQYL